MIGLHVDRLRRVAERDRFFGRLHGLDRAQRVGLRPGGDAAEVSLDDRDDLLRLDVSDERDRHVRRDVVPPVERFGILAGERLQVAHVADDWLLVGVRGVRRGQELLEQAAVGRALCAKAPFFHDDIPLFVELAKHGIEESRRLEVGPELDFVRRQRVEIDRLIGARRCVHADAARAIDDLAELVLLDERVGRLLGVLESLLQGFELRGVRAAGPRPPRRRRGRRRPPWRARPFRRRSPSCR